MKSKVIVIFPYGGYEQGTGQQALFWELMDVLRNAHGEWPIVVLNRDTEELRLADTFLRDRSCKPGAGDAVHVERVWAVDTCQMWLAGWGYVIDTFPDCERIVQVAGDIVQVQEKRAFFENLRMFLLQGPHWDILVGDFTSGERFSAKDLIDWYGTYVLLANWFPGFTKAVLGLPLNRPRSEFLNLKVAVLRELLKKRKFAYEQTLTLLIRSWDFDKEKAEGKGEWKYKVGRHVLGNLLDVPTYRQYRGSLDQVERTERMLKLMWREMNQPDDQEDTAKAQPFLNEYQRLDRISTACRETAAVTMRSLLGIGS